MEPDNSIQDYKEGYDVDVFTGIRPTGNLTIANYLGAVKPLIDLQAQGLKTMIFVADMHGLTDNEPGTVLANVKEIVADYLALGLDPKKLSIFIQSHIAPELLELTMYLLRHITVAELLRVPALKDKLKNNQNPENANALLAMYPVLMASDILIQKSHYIPVGEDQRSHIEVTKLVARRFNNKYGNTLPVPETQVIKYLKILGLKGEGKMSKSDPDNAIFLTDTADIVHKKIKAAETALPGEMPAILESHFTVANSLTKNIDELAKLEDLRNQHMQGGKVMGEFKILFEKIVVEFLTNFQNLRKEVTANPKLMEDILEEGNKHAKENARKNLDLVKRALSL